MGKKVCVIIRDRENPRTQMRFQIDFEAETFGLLQNSGMELLILEASFSKDCELKPKEPDTMSKTEDLKEKTSTTRWLIQRFDLSKPLWFKQFTMMGCCEYTPNVNEALKFTNKSDADAYITAHRIDGMSLEYIMEDK